MLQYLLTASSSAVALSVLRRMSRLASVAHVCIALKCVDMRGSGFEPVIHRACALYNALSFTAISCRFFLGGGGGLPGTGQEGVGVDCTNQPNIAFRFGALE